MPFYFIGNAAWLDFLNTEPAGPDGARCDLVPTPDALLQWAEQAGLLAPDERDGADEAWLESARRFRSALRQAADAMLAGGEPPPTILAAVNAQLARNPLVTVLEHDKQGWRIEQRLTTSNADALFARLAKDFADTLASGRTRGLRQCERSDCVMMFIDTSKNRSRRWCSMETCGNREKAAGRRAREKEQGVTPNRA